MKHLILAALLIFTASAHMSAGIRTGAQFNTTKTPVSINGTKAQIDLPGSQHMRNTGGSDGYGLCVPTSVEVAGRWQNVPEVEGFQEWCTHRPGGSTATQLPRDLETFANSKHRKLPAFVQHTGSDDAFLRLILKTRRIPCMTYAGKDGFYNGTIAHMVNGAHLDGTLGAIIDNNRPGSWVWMPDDIMVKRWKGLDDRGDPLTIGMGGGRFLPHRPFLGVPVGGGWVFCWLNPPPPPKVGGGSVQPAPAPTTPRGRWERRHFANSGPTWFCWDGPKLLGVFDKQGWHTALSNGSWESATSAAPVDVLLPLLDDEPADPFCPPNKPNWGNGSTGAVAPQNRYWVNGAETTRAVAVEAVLNSLVDDSDKYHLSIVGLDPKEVAAWFEGPLADFASKVHVQVYAKDNWVVTDRLTSAVTIQEPAKTGGKIVGRWIAKEAPDLEGIRFLLNAIFNPAPPAPPEPTPAPTPHDPPAPPIVPPPAPPGPPAPPVPAPKGNSFVTLLIALLTALFWRNK